MNINMIHINTLNKIKVVILDIDGTLKDLCLEHNEALVQTLNMSGVKKWRKNIILCLNEIAMNIVKTGIFPTNGIMQRCLLFVYSIIAGVRLKKFSNNYYINYAKQVKVFNNVNDILNSLSSDKKVFFVTVNKQNYNLEECGISSNNIIYATNTFKVNAYKKLIKKLGIPKEQVIIIGDNLFDDLLSAKLLRSNCLLVNNYNSKFKNFICKMVNGKYLK